MFTYQNPSLLYRSNRRTLESASSSLTCGRGLRIGEASKTLARMALGQHEGVKGLCLEPHDLAISKYAAGREKDLVFTRELARRGLVSAFTRPRVTTLGRRVTRAKCLYRQTSIFRPGGGYSRVLARI